MYTYGLSHFRYFIKYYIYIYNIYFISGVFNLRFIDPLLKNP